MPFWKVFSSKKWSRITTNRNWNPVIKLTLVSSLLPLPRALCLQCHHTCTKCSFVITINEFLPPLPIMHCSSSLLFFFKYTEQAGKTVLLIFYFKFFVLAIYWFLFVYLFYFTSHIRPYSFIGLARIVVFLVNNEQLF